MKTESFIYLALILAGLAGSYFAYEAGKNSVVVSMPSVDPSKGLKAKNEVLIMANSPIQREKQSIIKSWQNGVSFFKSGG